MSTNKTQNYKLHSWVPEDDFLMAEINENFDLLDKALKAEAQTAAAGLAGKADTATLTALQTKVDAKADKTTVDTKADKATVTALDKTVKELSAVLGKKVEIMMGNYVGDGKDNRPFSLGRVPAAVHIEQISGSRDLNGCYGGLYIPTEGGDVTPTKDGFSIGWGGGMNRNGTCFIYMAFFTAG